MIQLVIMRNEITHIRESWSVERTTYEERVVTLQQQLQASRDQAHARDQETQQWTRQINDLKAAHQVELSHCLQDRSVLQNQLAELQRIHATILAESQQNQKQIQSISDDKQGKSNFEVSTFMKTNIF
jgi:chromosome segregation ATPase